MASLPPPPTNDQTGSYAWLEWFRQLRNYISTVGSVPWNIINFAGSAISDIANRSHQLLQSLQGGTTGQYYHLTQSDYNEVSQNLNLSGTSGTGIKVDLTTPTFGWRDILGQIQTKGVGASDPDWVVYRGSVYQYKFAAGHLHEAWVNYHVPHDYVPGSDLYIHVHWSENVVDTGGTAGAPGNVKWYFDITYADGHGTAGGAADPFVAPITVSVVQQASTTRYGHMIAEVQFTNNGGTGGLLNSNTIQVDGLFLVRIYRDPADVADTLNQEPFVHMLDLHYQSHNLATKNKSPNFYA
jgi:hypothetical protein